MSYANELVDRYLAAVGRRLPDDKQRADIVAELREAVTAKLEAEEARLGRPLDKTEAADLVKAFGSPILAASRYRGQEYLIGPTLYPYYWPAVRLVAGVVAALAMVGALVPALLSDKPIKMALRGIDWALNGALISFGILTIVFIVMERTKSGAKIEAAWRPLDLPIDLSSKPKTLFESLFALAWDLIVIAWWVGLLRFPDIRSHGNDEVSLTFNPAWATLYWPVLTVMVLSAAVHLADVFHPTWSRLRSVVVLAADGVGLFAIWTLATAGRLVEATSLTGRPDLVVRVQGSIDLGLKIAMLVGALVLVGSVMFEIWRLTRSFRLPGRAAGLSV